MLACPVLFLVLRRLTLYVAIYGTLAMLMAKYGADCTRKFRMKGHVLTYYIIFIGVNIAILAIRFFKPIYMP